MPFKNENDHDLIARSASVVQAFTPEVYAYLVSLLPTPDGMQASHNSYTASYAGFLAGDPEKAKECEAQRAAVCEGLSILLGLAKAVTVKDPKVPEALNLGAAPTRKSSTSAELSQPNGFKVVFDTSGHITASVEKVKSARGYEVWLCDGDPNLETNWRLAASSPTCRKIIVSGLDRSKSNWLRSRAMGGKGTAGPWSNLVNLPPT
jgi:hypothetical protein